MSRPCISVQGLGKRFELGQMRAHNTLRDHLADAAGALLSRFRSGGESGPREFWALRDVSFDVAEGDVVGVIGRNGAGKSTLLKILSQISEPTEGEVRIRGRVASLLEVGTGFHPELTGRENVFLNGAILGMSKREIRSKFDEIVAFAEVEKFLDTPIKRYSSGMHMRLAFAVAAHLESEILLIDEVLAVGDAGFQKRCLGKMDDVARKQGRTILFVSHNMAAVAHLCSSVLLVDRGRIAAEGPSEKVIPQFLTGVGASESYSGAYSIDSEKLVPRGSANAPRCAIETIELLDLDRKPLRAFGSGDGFIVRLGYWAAEKVVAPAFGISISNLNSVELLRLSTMPMSGFYIESIEGAGVVELRIPALPVAGTKVTISAFIARANVEVIFRAESVVALTIEPRDVYGSGMAIDDSRGVIVAKHEWNHQPGDRA